MNLNSRPPSFLSMTGGQLQLALKKHIALKNCLSSKLPDSGEKLNESIARIRSILESKEYLPSPPSPPLTQSPNISRKSRGLLSSSDGVLVEDEEEDSNECVDDLVIGLGSLNIGCAKSVDAEADEDLSKLPKESLTPDEISDLRRLCNLPRSYTEGVSYHAFFFKLEPINAQLVCLVIIDCQNSKSQFIRHGVASTWATEDAPLLPNITMQCDTPLAAPGVVVAEMWRFVRQESAMEWPLLIADCEASLTRLRRLFCGPSARHHTEARNTVPRNIRFAVDNATNSNAKACELEERQLSEASNMVASLVARAEHFARLDAATLAKLRPQTVVWIEAPLTLNALRAIADMPSGPVACQPPYTAPAVPSKSTQQVTPGSSPILNSVNRRLLIRLAATGFNPSSLALLAGQARWRGFAGLLAASRVSRSPEDLANLYRLFRRVYHGLALNTDLYREDPSKPSCSPLWTTPVRQLKTLTMEESLEVMTRVRDDMKISQKEGIIKVRPSLPPASAMLLKYREQQAEDSDDTLCGDSDDD